MIKLSLSFMVDISSQRKFHSTFFLSSWMSQASVNTEMPCVECFRAPTTGTKRMYRVVINELSLY